MSKIIHFLAYVVAKGSQPNTYNILINSDNMHRYLNDTPTKKVIQSSPELPIDTYIYIYESEVLVDGETKTLFVKSFTDLDRKEDTSRFISKPDDSYSKIKNRLYDSTVYPCDISASLAQLKSA